MFFYQIFHNLLHISMPLIVSFYFYKKNFRNSGLIMLSAYLIDLDHFLAEPVFDPDRCSIGFHPLHSYYAVGLYALLVYFPKTRILGIGLLIHIFVDISDCARIYFI